MAGKFTAQLKVASGNMMARVDKVRRASILELFSLVILATPVELGGLRGAWQTSINSPKLGKIDRKDPTGSMAIAEVLANMGALVDVVYMSNTMPYAARIEFDEWSAQAPKGMMRLNALRWQEIVAAKAKGYSDK